ncbi:hypothetical protein HQ447_20895 [bacterium]|nr:hypothetical protein [bacterium]
MRNLLFASLALAVFASLAAAQNTRTVKFRTLCLDYANGIRNVVIPGKVPPEVLKIRLYSDISPVLEGVFNGNEASFYIDKPPGPDGKPVRELVGQAEIGKSAHQLFIFLPGDGSAGKLPYVVRSYDDDTTTFALGSVRAINLAPVPIRFQLSGELTPQVPPAKYAQFPHSKKVDEYNIYPVVVEFLSGSGEWINVQSVSWKATDRRRDLVITLVDPKHKQPAVRMFADSPPWLQVAPTAPVP